MNRTELIAYISEDPGLSSLFAHVDAAAAAEAVADASHDVEHLLRVARWTVAIGATEGVDAREAVAAALLHDLVNVPKSSPDRARASELSADAARPLLAAAGFGPAAVARIADAIRDHSFSRGAQPTEPLAASLQDADRLEAVGAIGVMRTFATGQRMGAEFFHAADPWATERELDDRRYSVDHFFTKLLGLPETMRTRAGRAEGERRVASLRAFLDDVERELGVPRPR